ncbi:MAG: hypothetical protein ACRENS_02185 [Candidatus Eiseniibacteriota bacterium]
MPAKIRIVASIFVLGLVCASACASVGSAPTATLRRFTRVNVHVDGWGGTAVLIDRDGRRTGWTRNGVVREIKGCGSQSGSEDGIPISSDTTGLDADDKALIAATLARDSLLAEQEPEPTWHFFDIRNDIFYHGNDAAKLVGLIDQGGCELRLDPIFAGTVWLSIVANGTGLGECQDTTSAWVQPGVPSRWRLAWKVVGDSCVVKISRLEERGSASPGPK